MRLPSPAMVVALVALFAALGGTVYAGSKINGKRIKPKSVPGNRLKPHSVPANRLKRGVLKGTQSSGQLTGADINELTLGPVPNSSHAETADSALSAVDAQTAVNAVNAVNAQTVNGHTVGCKAGTQLFAGACWQTSPSEASRTAPEAAEDCALHGGALPEALQLVAFANQPGVSLAEGDEWSGDITNTSGLNTYSVITVSPAGGVDFKLSTLTRRYRCVLPVVS